MWLSLTRFVTISETIAAACEAEACRCYPYETGGAFMGRRGSLGEYHVESMIGPGAGADHRASSFRPDAEWQWSEMRRLHGACSAIAFLGDWHTHPNAVLGRLSGMDRQALEEILSSDQTRADAVLSVILSGGSRRWKWHAWEASFRRRNIGRTTLSTQRYEIKRS